MSYYIPEHTPPVIAGTIARIERRLEYPGEVVVRQGGRVEPEDVVARGQAPQPPHILNVARQLAIPPNEIRQAMRLELGSNVKAGQLIARAGRISGRRCVAPVDGMISTISPETGYVAITPEPQEIQLTAQVRGVVMEILPHSGVIIETPAAQVYGAFGIGSERNGVLRLLTIDPHEVVEPEQIDARSAYAILICGAGITAAGLRRAVEEQVRGIIVGGIDEADLREFLGWSDNEVWRIGAHSWQIPVPNATHAPELTLVLTEGFGVRPMSRPIFDILSQQSGMEAFIEGTTRLRRPMRRPRVVVPLNRSTGAQVDSARPQLHAGATVRLLDAEHLGQIARIRTLTSTPQQVASGVRLQAVEIVTEDDQVFWVPRSCVEVLA
jgi:hypothetical protein